RKLLKGLQYVPRVIITDKLKSYGAAKREILPGVEHRQSRYLNNRCENSHRPTRQREYRMQGFKSAGQVQRFLSAYGPIAQHFRPRRPLWSAAEYRQEMKNRFESWAEITGTEWAAYGANRTGEGRPLVLFAFPPQQFDNAWPPLTCWSSGMAYGPTRRVSCPSRKRNLVCKRPVWLYSV